jgi:hypothetical protein
MSMVFVALEFASELPFDVIEANGTSLQLALFQPGESFHLPVLSQALKLLEHV